MTTDIDLARLGRVVSKALRHDPSRFGVVLDEDGWTDAAELCLALSASDPSLGRVELEHLEQLAEEDNTPRRRRQRFELVGERIRARWDQTHHGTVAHPPTDDVPAVLYASISASRAQDVLQQGLTEPRGGNVHLSVSVDDAQQVEHRRLSDEALVQVDTTAARHDGARFFRVDDDFYLTERIRATALSLWAPTWIDSPAITLERSREIAEVALGAMSHDRPVRLADRVIERPRHWVWYYNTVQSFETGDFFQYGYVGHVTFAVSKEDGRVRYLVSTYSIEDQV